MNITYNIPLVIFAIVIAFFGSYTSLELVAQVPVTRGQSRVLWLIGGAITLGNSIWLMHFIATLAYQVPVPITCDSDQLWLSVMVAILSSGLGLFIVSWQSSGWKDLLFGASLIGFAIIGMHFTAVSTIRLHTTTHYDFKLIFLSGVCAISLSFGALWLTFYPDAKRTIKPSIRKLGSTLLAATAIYGMHFLGISAILFKPSLAAKAPVFSISITDNAIPIIATGTTVLIVLTLEQLEKLRELDCEYGQGYFFSKPLDYKAATALMAINLPGSKWGN